MRFNQGTCESCGLQVTQDAMQFNFYFSLWHVVCVIVFLNAADWFPRISVFYAF